LVDVQHHAHLCLQLCRRKGEHPRLPWSSEGLNNGNGNGSSVRMFSTSFLKQSVFVSNKKPSLPQQEAWA
ncbi:hypothetical protein, partial [Thermoactinomyces sp. CICC 10521]|uniref:hypothetical protein n=1 Tax=Thermoactinomyces sp. CICC 10521 TaxID=2767426 RepID=UPI001E3460EE